MSDTPNPEDQPDQPDPETEPEPGPDESGVGDPGTPSDAGNAEVGDGQ